MRSVDTGLKHLDKFLRSLKAPEAHIPVIHVHDPAMGSVFFSDLDVHGNPRFSGLPMAFKE
jgi:hypothetical protein